MSNWIIATLIVSLTGACLILWYTFHQTIWYAFHQTMTANLRGIRDEYKKFRVREQVVDDPVSGLTFQFATMPDGEARLRVYGEILHYGNRELVFRDGRFDGAGTYIKGDKPAWPGEL